MIAAQRSLPLSVSPPLPELNVLNGAHAGVIVALESTTVRIGTLEDCDIVLRDPDIQSIHLTLHIHRRFLAIEATGGDVQVGNARVGQGHGYRCRLPVELSIGQTTLRLAHRPGVDNDSRRKSAQWGAIGLVGLLIVAAYLWQSWSGSSAAPAPEIAPAASVPANRIAALPQPELQVALRDRLDQAGLQQLTIDSHANSVRVSGRVDSDQRTRWIEVQSWYDRTWGNVPVLRNDVLLAPPPSPPRVHFRAVWLGPQPYVIGERGERLYPGAALADGWVLQRIESDRLILARQGRTFELTL